MKSLLASFGFNPHLRHPKMSQTSNQAPPKRSAKNAGPTQAVSSRDENGNCEMSCDFRFKPTGMSMVLGNWVITPI